MSAFLIARYLPDLGRGEAKNIGILVWTPGAVATRFLDPENVDFVEDHENFWRWVEYWSDLASQKRLQVFSDRPVTNGTVRFLKAIQKTQKGNFLLSDGGEIVEDVSAVNVAEVAPFLFETLVASKPKRPEERTPGLDAVRGESK